MSKKKWILVLAAVVLAVVCLECASRIYGDHQERAYRIVSYEFTYDTRKYSSWINHYPDGKNVGHIENAKDAVNKQLRCGMRNRMVLVLFIVSLTIHITIRSKACGASLHFLLRMRLERFTTC